MPVTILIPSTLQHLTRGQRKVSAEGSTVEAVLRVLDGEYSGLKSKILNDNDQVRSFISLYVNAQDVRNLKGLGSELKDGDEVAIIPAMAGG